VLTGGTGLEDGFEFAHDARRCSVARDSVVRARAASDAQRLDVWATSSADCEWWRAAAPGPPGGGERHFRLVRAHADTGTHQFVWSWSGDVVAAAFGDGVRVALADGTVHHHRRSSDGWHVDLTVGDAHSGIDLGNTITNPDDLLVHGASRGGGGEDRSVGSAVAPLVLRRSGRPSVVQLGEEHYRRSEQSWGEAGRPSATVTVAWIDDVLAVAVDVMHSDRTFASATAVNRLDNEHADVNGDSVQLYVRSEAGVSGWMLVPERDDDRVRARLIDGWRADQPLRARWWAVGDGYRMEIHLPFSAPPLALDVIVNEMPGGRVRRRGQLVMSGARGEFVYLQGDRHEADRLIPLRISDG
jgi:hypothetical protein